jgi:LppP/LprE lipoprotein
LTVIDGIDERPPYGRRCIETQERNSKGDPVNKLWSSAVGVFWWRVLAARASAADTPVTTSRHLEAIAARRSRGEVVKRGRARLGALICGVVLVAACSPSHKTFMLPTTPTSAAGSVTTSGSPTTKPAAPTTSPRISPPATLPAVPSLREISLELNRTVEIADGTTHFSANSQPVTISDAAGGWLTAVIGVRFPTADGKGQLAFFWHNTAFIGLDTDAESIQIMRLSATGPGTLAVRYTHYAPTDPLCCPSLAPVTIDYHWDGHAMTPSGLPPGHRAGEAATITTLP